MQFLAATDYSVFTFFPKLPSTGSFIAKGRKPKGFLPDLTICYSNPLRRICRALFSMRDT